VIRDFRPRAWGWRRRKACVVPAMSVSSRAGKAVGRYCSDV
jgi:hypothetical protein